MANALGHVSRCCLNKKHRMPGGFVSFGKYNAYAFVFLNFFFFCIFFPEVQSSGFIFMKAREENCSFAVEHFFVICPPLPSNMTASLTPCPLLGGAYINVDATSFLLPPPFPIKICVTLCTSGASGTHRHWCHLECNCTDTLWELNFVHRTAGRCLHSADVGLYSGTVYAWPEACISAPSPKAVWVVCCCTAAASPIAPSCKRLRHSAMTFGAAGYG